VRGRSVSWRRSLRRRIASSQLSGRGFKAT
jgi:hypothetical protein